VRGEAQSTRPVRRSGTVATLGAGPDMAASVPRDLFIDVPKRRENVTGFGLRLNCTAQVVRARDELLP